MQPYCMQSKKHTIHRAAHHKERMYKPYYTVPVSFAHFQMAAAWACSDFPELTVTPNMASYKNNWQMNYVIACVATRRRMGILRRVYLPGCRLAFSSSHVFCLIMTINDYSVVILPCRSEHTQVLGDINEILQTTALPLLDLDWVTILTVFATRFKQYNEDSLVVWGSDPQCPLPVFVTRSSRCARVSRKGLSISHQEQCAAHVGQALLISRDFLLFGKCAPSRLLSGKLNATLAALLGPAMWHVCLGKDLGAAVLI